MCCRNYLSSSVLLSNGYAIPLILLTLPKSVKLIGVSSLTIGHANITVPPPLGGAPLAKTLISACQRNTWFFLFGFFFFIYVMLLQRNKYVDT